MRTSRRTWGLVLVAAALWGTACAGPGTRSVATDAVDAGLRGRVAFLRNDGVYWQVWVLDLESRAERQLTKSAYEKARISWYADGSAVLVSALDGRIVRVDADSGAEFPIPVSLPGARDAALSPDGRQIAVSLVTSEVLDTNEIHVLDASGENLRKVLRIREFQHEPQWSADGKAIYFLSFSRNNLDHDIWRASLDGSALERLTTGNAYHLDLAGASDERLAFSNNRTGDYEIWTWDRSAASEPVRVTTSPGLDGGPTWGPGDDALIFHSTRTGSLQLWSIEIESGELIQLTRDPSPSRGAVWWSP